MKKLILILTIVGTSIPSFAQDAFISQHSFNVGASILVLALVMLFVLTIMKRLLQDRIKNRIIEKGIPESLALSVLENTPKEDQNANLKWALILAGLGLGLLLTYYTQPIGIHSLAILTFCLSASFLAYFFYIKSSK
jgi:hypothetical protein